MTSITLASISWPEIFYLSLHSILEAFPISSSWHLAQLNASSTTVHNFHVWIFPIIALYTLHQHKHSEFLKLPCWVLICSIVPTVCCYVLLKSHIILEKIRLPAAAMHSIMGGLLLIIAIRQIKGYDGPKLSTASVWILSGLLQCLAMIFPGASRLGTSLLYALFYKIDFKKAFVISFSLNVITIGAGMSLDVFKNTLVLPSALELLIASLSFIAAIFLAHKTKWWFIGGCGAYRVGLGLFMALL